MDIIDEGETIEKVSIAIVASDLETSVRKRHLKAYINLLDLGAVVDILLNRPQDFKEPQKFYGGGMEKIEVPNGKPERKLISRQIKFTKNPDGSLQIALAKGPGVRNAEGGVAPDGNPTEQIYIVMRGFALTRLLYRLQRFVEDRYMIGTQIAYKKAFQEMKSKES